MYEIFELLLKQFNVTTYKVAKDTGINQSTFSNWKTRRNLIGPERGKIIADYFGVSLDYLMTGEEVAKDESTWNPTLTEKDKLDVAKEVENLLAGIDADVGLSFDGEAMDDVSKELLKNSLENTLENIRLIAKEKYTPKKYRK